MPMPSGKALRLASYLYAQRQVANYLIEMARALYAARRLLKTPGDVECDSNSERFGVGGGIEKHTQLPHQRLAAVRPHACLRDRL